MIRALAAQVYDHSELFDRWRRTNLRKARISEVVLMLERRFSAYEIPIESISADDYKNDEEVDEKHLAKLMTITDPRVLNQIYGPDEWEHKETDPGEIDADWRSVLQSDDVTYSMILAQHSQGTRTTILLESVDGVHPSGSKVYGTSYLLTDLLVAKIGVKGMEVGNLEDRNFQFYLECCARSTLI